jgi:hypothetical protein
VKTISNEPIGLTPGRKSRKVGAFNVPKTDNLNSQHGVFLTNFKDKCKPNCIPYIWTKVYNNEAKQ